MTFTRRGFLATSAALPLLTVRGSAGPAGTANPLFPAQESPTVKRFVIAAHGDLATVKAMVAERPALARSSWDWGFGDWETPIDAASHMGNRPIADVLLANGARPTIFTAAMLGQLAIVQQWIETVPGIQRNRGPHGITLLTHAKHGGAPAVAVVSYLERLGDADPQYPNEPISDADSAAISGTYRFGDAEDDVLVVARKGNDPLGVQRPGNFERPIFHHGGLVFNPMGAEAVRIRFELANGRAAALIVQDGPVTVRAPRA